jgi:ribonuclease HII
MKQRQKWLIGVDEAGRGPLAGPVAVGVVCVAHDFNWCLIEGVNDSKKLSEKKREAIYVRAKELQKEGKLDFAVCLVSAKTIDTIGIVPSIQKAMNQALQKLHRQGLCIGEFEDVLVKLDGGLKAPSEYIHQETIIKGDSKEKVIGLASIMAKVTRDRAMVRLSKDKEYAKYGFEVHKGYGTKVHREAILKNGLSKEHRATFCKNLHTTR